MTAFRIFFPGIIILMILFYQQKFKTLTKQEWIYTIIASLSGASAHHLLLAVGLMQTTASNAALILALLPLTTTLLTVIFYVII